MHRKALLIREQQWEKQRAEIMAEGEEERMQRFADRQKEKERLDADREPLQRVAEETAQLAAESKARFVEAKKELKANETASITEISRKKNRRRLEKEVRDDAMMYAGNYFSLCQVFTELSRVPHDRLTLYVRHGSHSKQLRTKPNKNTMPYGSAYSGSRTSGAMSCAWTTWIARH